MAKPVSSKKTLAAGANSVPYTVAVRVPQSLKTLQGVVESINSLFTVVRAPRPHSTAYQLVNIPTSTVRRIDGEIGKSCKVFFIATETQRPITGTIDHQVEGTNLVKIVGEDKEGNAVTTFVAADYAEFVAANVEAPDESTGFKRKGKVKAEVEEKPVAAAKKPSKK